MHFTYFRLPCFIFMFFTGIALSTAVGCGDDASADTADIEGDVSGECNDDADNDRDGLFDCNDPDCAGSPVCENSGDTSSTQDSGSSRDTSRDTGSGVQDTGSANAADTILYDGETAPYALGESWDETSTIAESTESPHSTPRHIRANIVTADDWGAVVYYFDSGEAQDWRAATRLALWIKGDHQAELELALVCLGGDGYTFGSSEILQLATQYQQVEIDVSTLSNDVDISQVVGIILYAGSGQVTADLDNITVAFGGETTDSGSSDVTDTGTATGEVVDSDTESATNVIDTETGTSTEPTGDVHYFGRFDHRNPNSPACAWSNCGAGVRFQGTALDVQLSGAGGISFQVVLDGVLHNVITTDGSEWSEDSTPQTYHAVQGASAGMHNVELYRNPEAMFGAVSFHGFTATNGEVLPSPPPFSRIIEVIGDSISAGYGNDGCPFAAATEIGSAAYGPLAARALGAVAQVIAMSGQGMVMSFDGNTEDQLPDLYQYAVPTGDMPTWNYSNSIPDVVVINLGTNDFSGGVNRNVFISTYETFVTRLRGYYPDAYILLAVNGASDDFSDSLDTIIANLADNNVEKINLDNPNWNGCDGHPDLAAHQAMADVLASRLEAELGW